MREYFEDKEDRKNYFWVLGTIVLLALLSRFDLAFKIDTHTIALWRFNSTDRFLVNESNNFELGYIIGASPIEGLFDQSRFFNGTQDYVIIPHADSLNPVQEFTIELWIYPMSITTHEGTIFCKGLRNGGESYCIDLVKAKEDSYHFRFFIRGKTNLAAVMSDPIEINRWSYLACIYNGSSLEMYINGVLTKRTLAPFHMKNNSHNLSIGASKPSDISAYTLFFRGIIEQIRFSNIARSQTEIHDYYKRFRKSRVDRLYPYYFWGIITLCAFVLLSLINRLKGRLYR